MLQRLSLLSFLSFVFLTNFGQTGKSLVLDGRSNYYQISNHSDLNSSGSMTIEFWIKPNCIDYVFLVTKQRCNGQFGYSLAIRNGKLVWSVSPDGICNSNSMYETDSAVLEADIFTHVALVQNQTSISIYINGTLVDGSFVQGSARTPRSSTRPLIIGAYTNINGSMGTFYSGLIDEFRFWKTALTANQINQRMNDTLVGNEQDLVLYFDMEFNTSGNNANLTNRANTGSTFNATVNGASTNTPYFTIDSTYDDRPFQLADTIHSCQAYNQNTNISTYYHSLTWNTGQTTPNITLTNGGLYHLEIERERCKIFRDTLFFDRQTDIVVEETVDKCRGKSIEHRLFTIDEFKTYRDTIPSPNGCDSLFTINVNQLPDIEREEQYEICNGETVNIYNLTISSTGIYYDTLIGTIGCDTILTINIDERPLNQKTESFEICTSDTLYFGNKIITESGTYYDTISIFGECDTVVTILVTELPFIEKIDTLEICTSDTIFIGNLLITTVGTYFDTIQATQGCDTIHTIEVIQGPNYIINENYQLCRGKSLNIRNLIIENPGVYYDTIQTSFGCDTTVIMEVEEIPDILRSINYQICQGDSFAVGDRFIKTSGQYFDTLNATIGCDTIIEYNVELKNASDTNITLLACDGQPIDFLGHLLTNGTDTQFVITNHLECDSIINVRVDDKYTGGFLENEINTCENSIILSSPNPITTWNNFEISSEIIINQSGTYYGSYYDENGCLVSDTAQITFIGSSIYVPNAFSPNDDYINECYKPIIPNGTEITNYRFLIYNRWGELILQTNDPLYCWDGTYKNKNAPEGVYLFIVTGYIDDCNKVISEKGLVYLVR